MANGETSLRIHLLDKPEPSDVGNLTSRVSDGGGFEWVSVIDAVGGALAGAALGSTDAESSSVLESFGDSETDGSLFSDAQPFDYVPDDLGGAVDLLAGGEGTPGNNQAQNKQFKAVVKALGLNKDQAQELQMEISRQGLGYHEIMERALDMFGD